MGKEPLKRVFFEWIEKHPDLAKSSSSLSQLFRTYYNREDLLERAKKINAFSPDIAIVIHYNSHVNQAQNLRDPLTSLNYNLAFIPGAFCAGELKDVKNRYEFLRLIVTDDIDQSFKLSQRIVRQFVSHLKVPLIVLDVKTPYTESVCLILEQGIYCRNLTLTRLVHCPVCYGETLVQNNEDEIHRLSSQDISIGGVSCSKRIKEVA